jgi:IS30 family transposase
MHKHLNKESRAVIAAMRRSGYSQTDIARTIGVHRSTVSRELKINKTPRGRYFCSYAQTVASKRRKESKKDYRKIENDPILEAKIEARLCPLVSPEVVAHELGIVHETIYAWMARSRRNLYPQLAQRGRKRRRYGSKRALKQGWTKHVRSIDERPETLYAWEGDTVKGKTKSRLLTHVERESLFTLADLMPNGGADAVQAVLEEKSDFEDSTITYDRGSEFALWRMIEEATGAEVYFAHAHHPWERGKNENTNGRLRRVFPKKFNFDTIKQADVNRVVWIMNHTPRKSLSWQTPCRAYGKCCDSS